MAGEKLTPLMEQYFQIRKQYPDTLLLFQVGDFYELFFEDAKTGASFLAIALTKRGKCKGEDVPLCGIPVHALNHYLTKLVRGGFKVAICDQVSKPLPGMVVRREVTRVFTPGTLTDSHMLDEKSASYILFFYAHKNQWSLVFSELLTAQTFATHIPSGDYKLLESELSRFFPDEVVLSHKEFSSYFKKLGYWVSETEISDPAESWISKQFNPVVVETLNKNIGTKSSVELLYNYLYKTQRASLNQFKTMQFYKTDDYLYLDASTQRNLELIRNNQDGGRANTLLSIIDHSKTAMGSRMIKKILTRPLLQNNSILQRQEVVIALKNNVSTMQRLEELLSQLSDLERIVGRVALKKATVQDYISLKLSLKILPHIKNVLSSYNEVLLKSILEKLIDFSSEIELLEASLDESGEMFIKKGFNYELDRLSGLINNSQKSLLELESQEISRTGINSLKIRYNKVSGYVIEVTKTHIDKVPDDYKRLQTLTNKERFVTKDLLVLQNDITKAQNEIGSLESELFEEIKETIYKKLSALRHVANSLAYLDALYGFAHVAYENNYIAPQFNSKGVIDVRGGRHPVVETKLDKFVPNDTKFTDNTRLWVVTGPNMGGKSTYLRQVALISLLAQCGSLVPADFASLPIIDRIFTRIGSGDNLAEGKSTFLVEMEETAIICNQATKNSLVILDEVGRGTSTFDGLAIAQSVIEYIHDKVGAKCLFATHYHELTNLKLSGVENYHMLCVRKNGIVFLHKIEKGVSKGSFGIDVAILSGMPSPIISRAKDILDNLGMPSVESSTESVNQDVELLKAELQSKEAILRSLKELNFDELSPKAALDILWSLKDRL